MPYRVARLTALILNEVNGNPHIELNLSGSLPFDGEGYGGVNPLARCPLPNPPRKGGGSQKMFLFFSDP